MTLQPRSPQPINLQSAKIIWFALNASILIYVGILITLQKIHGIWLPFGEPSLLEKIALGSSFLLVGTFFFHAQKINGLKFNEEKFVFYLLAWAINEIVVLIAFVATMNSESGNGFYILLNGILTILANALAYPRQG